jgi:hypothetical protein
MGLFLICVAFGLSSRSEFDAFDAFFCAEFDRLFMPAKLRPGLSCSSLDQ